MKHKLLTLLLVVLSVGLLGSCNTVPETISEDLAPNEYLQKGQESMDLARYELALLYYHSFIERFPDMHQKVVEAEYEIALIYLKRNDLDTAGNLFSAIIEKYNQPGAEVLPAWPQALSVKLLDEIYASVKASDEATEEE